MRLMVDSLIALMLVGILAAVLLHYRQAERDLANVQFLHTSLAKLHEQAMYHAAMDGAESDSDKPVFPQRISPSWFDDLLPVNVLLSMQQPWIDVAPEGDMSSHPPDPVIRRYDQAGFWYNPNRGIFRARVPYRMSDLQTLELYNQVNGTSLLALPMDSDADRRPRYHRVLAATVDTSEEQSAQQVETVAEVLKADQVMRDTIAAAEPAEAQAAAATATTDDPVSRRRTLADLAGSGEVE